MTPTLPQNAPGVEQEKRKQQLAQLQTEYVYDFTTRVQPLGVAQSVPAGQGFAFVWTLGVLNQALGITGNLISMGSHLFESAASLAKKLEDFTEEELHRAEKAYLELKTHHLNLSRLFDQTHVISAPASAVALAGVASGQGLATGTGPSLAIDLGGGGGTRTSTASPLTPRDQPAAPASLEQFAEGLKDSLGHLSEFLGDTAFDLLLRVIGQYGQAKNLQGYQSQFQLLPMTPGAGAALDDVMFARLRVAGPNPVVLRRLSRPDARFPVTEAQFRSTMGPDDSLAAAMGEGRVYLADYAVLEGLKGGTFPKQKYVCAPLALFAVPRAGEADRLLRAVAIQCSQTPGPSTPVVTPAEGLGWQVARLFLQVADGTWHEMISHLGLTHLLTEAFTLATARQLPPEHPLQVLLTPHFQGTLAINNAAVESLIAPGGFVDRLLPGTIEASASLAVQAVEGLRFNQELFPRTFANRGVDDAQAFPDYPYRDDGLLVWASLHQWVSDYVSLYYGSDADVSADYELQAWLKELASPQGGRLQDIGEGGSLRTRGYLADLVTMIIFTASAQHAAVNFPQSYVMSFTPSLPLAAYAPLPGAPLVAEPANIDALLAYLPPLQQAFSQQTLMTLLGSVYFGSLGSYDRYSAGPYFQDPRVAVPLKDFQQRLGEVEATIARRNLRRIPYRSLLPSEIPQSINI
ncbi:lipoxygenase family protein [Corallococcus sp. BB11-1]|uniref:lipoxygenase family protein n=1 Tax=Corallococcus sp. BB11-1 TaxID=2996783 RepID=UPI002270A9EC|nr:lipoxygenase family protein [Corallococcus sp. BB11-1]MCY1036012.1 lipoxygenase family protein [Corallococcus sp. BB11-1]